MLAEPAGIALPQVRSKENPAGRLDEGEWVALADGDDLGALADQGGHELECVPPGTVFGMAWVHS